VPVGLDTAPPAACKMLGNRTMAGIKKTRINFLAFKLLFIMIGYILTAMAPTLLNPINAYVDIYKRPCLVKVALSPS
jgi:hypothetical protein